MDKQPRLVLIYGASGAGKTSSLRNFDKDEIALINIANKPMPFRGGFESSVSTKDYEEIKALMGKTKKKSIVLDDSGYLLQDFFLNHTNENTGKMVWDLYTKMAIQHYKLLEWCLGRLSPDQIIYTIMHEETDDSGRIVPAIMGKALREKLNFEGLYVMTMRAVAEENKHKFLTKTAGNDVVKMPMGMFEEASIDNDLKMVDNKIREYYNLKPLKEEKNGD